LEFVVDTMARRLKGKKANLGVVHAQDPDAARVLAALAQERIAVQEIITTELSIGVAANLGPGTVGLVAYPVEEG